jgi:hypothetical protein
VKKFFSGVKKSPIDDARDILTNTVLVTSLTSVAKKIFESLDCFFKSRIEDVYFSLPSTAFAQILICFLLAVVTLRWFNTG